MKKQVISLNESQLRRIVKESVRRVLREENEDITAEVDEIVENLNSYVREWVSDTCFIDARGCNGYIYNSKEEATNELLSGNGLKNAIDFVSHAMAKKEWIVVLVRDGFDEESAKEIIMGKQWDKLVQHLVEKYGPEYFLSECSQESYPLSDGRVLFY